MSSVHHLSAGLIAPTNYWLAGFQTGRFDGPTQTATDCAPEKEVSHVNR